MNNSNFLNLFNQFNDMYEEVIMNDVMEQSMFDENPIKHILSEKGEMQLKHITYDNTQNMKECPITLREFNEGDIVTQLPCKHIFDSSGISWWLTQEQAKCPVCRMELDSVEISNPIYEMDTTTQPSFQTQPINLFSNITIDLSFNSNLLEPYNREYNIDSFAPLSYDDDNDDEIFFNTLQFLQDESNFMSNFPSIFNTASHDASNNDVPIRDISNNSLQ